ncbi:putative transposase [Stutzerimonas xanthomarina]|uniref:Transposase n=2 Tax=Stutzerimonas xanthomarina TaxID=271420 RepID=A0ABY0ZZJ9_9GAMM|nr:putative transposase [Stutzerimonas xanthomarina]SHH23183.1 putative transposase [Stutzerimonas xanthomarina DSM 18231]
MYRYRRAQMPGATYFFTVNLRNRRSDLLVRHIDLLRETVRATKDRHPFRIDAWVVLPDHMHCIWTLPDGDADFALRWKVIKFAFARRLPKTEVLTVTQRSRNERGIWQRRYWAHLIRDERDYRHHVDYVHLNPLKHGWGYPCRRLALLELPSRRQGWDISQRLEEGKSCLLRCLKHKPTLCDPR